MTRVTSDVDVLNDLFTSGVVTIFGDVFTLLGIMVVMVLDGLAAGAGRLLGAAAHRPRHAVVPPQRPRVVPGRARLDRAHQRVPAGEHHRHVDGAAVPSRRARTSRGSTTSTGSIATPTSSRSSIYAVFYPAIEVISALASALIIWYGGVERDARHARRSARSWRFCSIRSASSGRSATCRRSSTCCSRRWPRRSGSSSCSTSRSWCSSPAAPVTAAVRPSQGHIEFDHVWFAYNRSRRRAGLGAQGRVVRGASRASASASSAPPARARRR